MSILAELNKKSEEQFPQNKIILTNGRMLDCHPLVIQPKKIEDDALKLDKSGRYFYIGPKRHTPTFRPSADEESRQQLFVNNAFYLLTHSERILSDSRMFLCPVAIQNGLAYTGTSGFHHPTIGIYIEWWLLANNAMQTDEKGVHSLVYHLAGSPLTGMNRCSIVHEDAQTEVVTLSSFRDYWSLFMNINQRYTEAKQRYQAYTLQEVLDMLHREDQGNKDFSILIDNQFMKHHIILLNRRIKQLQEECQKQHEMFTDVLTKYNEEKILQLYAEYEIFEAKVSKEIVSLEEQKRSLKANLKAGCLNNVAYQKQLTPLKQRINDLKYSIILFKNDKVRETFPNEEKIDFSMIEHFICKKRNEDEKNQND